jgi:Fe-S-cluster-containing dehydrogenase component/CRP-like cAMP-binding protein
MSFTPTTVAETTIAKPKRWDEPFGPMTDAEVARLLQIKPFRHIDPSRFPPNLPLEGIVRNDMRVVEYESGDLVVREGDYGNSAFMILHGRVRVALERLPADIIGEPPAVRRSVWSAIKQLWGERQLPEVRRPHNSTPVPATRGNGQQTRVFLQDVPGVLDSTRTIAIGAGEFFGELAALARSQRTATVFAEGKAVLLEIRWQGLRELMRRSNAIRDHIDQLYRANSLRVHLRETPLLKGLCDSALDQVAEATELAAYGSFDWHLEMPQIEKLTPLERIAREPMIAEEGSPVDYVLLVRSGFARLSHRYGEGHRTLAYLGKGQAYGLEELLASDGSETRYQNSLRAIGHVDVLKIPAAVLGPLLREGGAKAIDRVTAPRLPVDAEEHLPSPLLDFLVDERFINGTQAMVIDLDRCTRCDDCVRACATTHQGNPRFVREGPRFGRYQIAGACMHCVDPVCMIGCPTGAIHRDRTTGVVRINDGTCIGCGTCAESCPYDNIHMVQLRNAMGAPLVDDLQQLPLLQATKCDLCSSQLTGPACQNACAHDALIRIDLTDLPTLAHWMDR